MTDNYCFDSAMISRTFSGKTRHRCFSFYCKFKLLQFLLRLHFLSDMQELNEITEKAPFGLDVNLPVEICGVLKYAFGSGFQFICLPIAHPRFKRELTGKCKNRHALFARSDLVLKTSQWKSLIIGKVSPYLDIDTELAKGQGKYILEQEMDYASHLNLPAIILPLRSSKCYNLARLLNWKMSNEKSNEFWISVPIISYIREASVWRSDLSEEVYQESTWSWWNIFYTFCNFDQRIKVILEISKELPDEKELDRWKSEPIKCLLLSTSIFLTNKKGYPVLSKPLQIFIKSFVPNDIQIIIKGNNHHYSLDCYQKYLNHIWQEANIQQNSEKENEEPFLMSLHPFTDNTSTVFEHFMQESAKYRIYIKAIYLCLLDLVKEEDKNIKMVNVMVLNAGKGCLVIAALLAAAQAERKVKILAVEKNPYSVMTLEAHQEKFWGSSVEIVFKDPECLKLSLNINLLLLESLGSFGDNELLPEITDLAQKFLKNDAVIIPTSCTTYLCPIQDSGIYSSLKANKGKGDCEKPCESKNIAHYKYLTFDVEQNCILHGFTGFFEATLYKDVKLSTVPTSHIQGISLWNPIFFPVMEPVHLKAGDQLEVHFWRIIGRTKVWYEWTTTSPVPLPVHNLKGYYASMPLG